MSPAADTERHGPVVPRERHRILHLGNRARPEHDSGSAAAHVVVADGRVAEVTGLDGVAGERGGNRVVVDSGRTLGAHGRRAHRSRVGAGPFALLRHAVAHGLGHGDERLHGARVIGREDERADAVLERVLDETIGIQVAPDVEQAADLPRITAGLHRGVVDGAVARGEVPRLQTRQGGQPAVGLRARESQHARLVRPQPDRYLVGGRGTTLGTLHAVKATVDPQGRPRSRLPDAADDVDGLVESRDGLPRRAPRRPHRGDRIPEGSRAEAERDPSAAQQVETRDGSREDGRLAQRQVEHVSRDGHPFGGCGHPRQQRPRVEERGLVGVVLKGDEVETELLGELGEGDGALGVGGGGRDEHTELNGVTVVGHDSSMGGSHSDTKPVISRLPMVS